MSEPHRRRHNKWLEAIAFFKFVKAVLMILVGLGALALLNDDVRQKAQEWTHLLQMHTHHRALHMALEKLGAVQDRSLETAGVISFLYAALLFMEGIGLWLEKRWGEYFTATITASFIPFEIFEIVKHATGMKLAVLAINVAVLAYLVAVLRRGASSKPS
ncbi:MAG: DUF2127 domain-containing protein [Verrucomicrobiia bacterium]